MCIIAAVGWVVDTESRPSFTTLTTEFAKMAKDPGRYLVIEVSLCSPVVIFASTLFRLSSSFLVFGADYKLRDGEPPAGNDLG